MKDFALQWIDECESTSRILKEQTKDQFSEPIALASAMQTAGSGRLGRTWHSPRGNLHLSLAIPGSDIFEHVKPLIPLAAGVVVAKWLQEFAGVSVCLKWPNDILLDGCKIGGLLCEASYQGTDFRGVVIGVGINLKNSPDSPHSDGYPTSSLLELTGKGIDPQEAARSLVNFWRVHWSNLSSNISKVWSEFSVSAGHFWVSSDAQDFYNCLGIDQDGHLRLVRANEKSGHSPEIRVTSVTNDFKWSPQHNDLMLVADIGNSQTKLALVRHSPNTGFSISSHESDPRVLSSFVAAAIKGGCAPVVHVISVNPVGVDSLRQTLEPLKVSVREIQKRPVRCLESNYDLQSIGADRLALLEAVHERHDRGRMAWPVLIASLGTATTLDHLDREGHHLGGYILAGLQTSLNAIVSAGSLLPKDLTISSKPDFYAPLPNCPKTTIDAMIRASVEATLAFLVSQRAKLALHCGCSVDEVGVILTGGFSSLVKSLWQDSKVVCEAQLALLGAGVLAYNGR